MSLPSRLAIAMAQGRTRLPPEAQGLLTAREAWPLGLLLAAWRFPGSAEGVQISAFSDIGMAFRFYAAELGGLVDSVAAVADGDEVALAGAGVSFAYAVQKIGLGTLRQILRGKRFADIQTTLLGSHPIPQEVERAFSGDASEPRATRTMSRAQQFAGFDRYPRESDPEVAYWRRQLERADLPAQMRWFYEQKLLAQREPMYLSTTEAERVWSDALRNPLQDELRAYFADNLRGLKGAG